MIALPETGHALTVVAGPTRHGSEQRWRVVLPDGMPATLAQLSPELADDAAVRRRYVRDIERLASAEVPGLAATLAWGPRPDPRAPQATPPWRLRAEPAGESLDAWLRRRAPAPIDEALALLGRLAEAVHAVHRAGLAMRDLHPRSIVLGDDGRVWITDIGLARVDILASRTASSAMLEGSVYAAPEHLRATVVDARADLYPLGVIGWQLLTGELPFAGGLFAPRAPLPPLVELRPGVPPAAAALLEACLAEEPDDRPLSAAELSAALRGEAVGRPSAALERTTCQACGAPLRPGLRLCLGCGKEAVQFVHTDEPRSFALVLTQARDDATFHARLRAFYERLGEGPPPHLAFLVGDERLYGKEERKALLRVPVPLLRNLDRATAERLAEDLRGDKLGVKVVPDAQHPGRRRVPRGLLAGGAAVTAGGVALLATSIPLAVLGMLAGVSALVAGAIVRYADRSLDAKPALATLRRAPAALPASDPLVARLAALLDGAAADLREPIAELALLVQRLVDRRASRGDDAELGLVTGPIEPLVALVEQEAARIAAIDRTLADLDEGTMVRALAASEARGEPPAARADLHAGLDRLRALEDARAGHMQRLLEAASLQRRLTELGLAPTEDDPEQDARAVRMALAALEGEL